MLVRMIHVVDIGSLRTEIIPETSAEDIIPVEGLLISTLPLTYLCYLLYFAEKKLYIFVSFDFAEKKKNMLTNYRQIQQICLLQTFPAVCDSQN